MRLIGGKVSVVVTVTTDSEAARQLALNFWAYPLRTANRRTGGMMMPTARFPLIRVNATWRGHGPPWGNP